MKKILTAVLLLLATGNSFAQNTLWPSTTASLNVGIGTNSPSSYFHGGNNKVLEISNPNTVLNSQAHLILSTNSSLAGTAVGTITWITKASTSSQGLAYIGSIIQGDPTNTASGNLVFATANGSGPLPRMTLDQYGHLGLGTDNPNAELDVIGAVMLPGSMGNTIQRPAVGATRITGEISGYSEGGTILDDGLLRLSAGARTNGSAKSYIDLSGFSTVNEMDRNILTGTAGLERMRITRDGNIGIGTANPDAKLAVVGTIHAKEIKVDSTVPTPDYVFDKGYDLASLRAVRTYIDQNHHLPEIPSAVAVAKDGINLGEMNAKLLKKIEELTLYLIEKDKQVSELQKAVTSIKQQLNVSKSKTNNL